VAFFIARLAGTSHMTAQRRSRKVLRIQIRKATRGSRSCYWERKFLVLLVERGVSPLLFILFIRIYLYILQCFSYTAFGRNGSLSIAFGRLCLGCSSLLSCSGYSYGLDAILTNSTIVYKALEMARCARFTSTMSRHYIGSCSFHHANRFLTTLVLRPGVQSRSQERSSSSGVHR
jgi:hypothetical protein